MQMNPDRSICRHSSQKQLERRHQSSLQCGAGGQDTGSDLLCHQLLIPRFRRPLPLLEPFPTLTFCFLLRGAEAFLWPLDLGLGLGRKKEGLCEECLPTGKTGGGVGEGSGGTLTADDPIFYIIHYTQGPCEGHMLIST